MRVKGERAHIDIGPWLWEGSVGPYIYMGSFIVGSTPERHRLLQPMPTHGRFTPVGGQAPTMMHPIILRI